MGLLRSEVIQGESRGLLRKVWARSETVRAEFFVRFWPPFVLGWRDDFGLRIGNFGLGRGASWREGPRPLPEQSIKPAHHGVHREHGVEWGVVGRYGRRESSSRQPEDCGGELLEVVSFFLRFARGHSRKNEVLVGRRDAAPIVLPRTMTPVFFVHPQRKIFRRTVNCYADLKSVNQ